MLRPSRGGGRFAFWRRRPDGYKRQKRLNLPMARDSEKTSDPRRPRVHNLSDSYWRVSTRPLHVLVFLLPLIVLYELGSAFFLSDNGRGLSETIGARKTLVDFFEAFGAATLYLPGVALIVVLFIWHLLERDSWRIRLGVLVGMAAEAVLWTLPLLVCGLLLAQAGRAHAASVSGDPLASLPWQARMTLSIGAGLYEELLFRLILIALVHFVLVDLARMRNSLGGIIAAAVSAVAFAVYHDVSLPSGGIDWRLAGFFALAGLYFATLFVVRGFGIVVAVHALYDIVVLVVVGGGK